MFELLKQCVDRWLTVPEPRLRSAIPELAAAAKVVAEGAGALAYAALEQLEPGPPTVAVVSGGNIDPTLLADLLSPAEATPSSSPTGPRLTRATSIQMNSAVLGIADASPSQ